MNRLLFLRGTLFTHGKVCESKNRKLEKNGALSSRFNFRSVNVAGSKSKSCIILQRVRHTFRIGSSKNLFMFLKFNFKT